MKLNFQSSVFLSFLLLSSTLAHTNSQTSNNNAGPFFGSVMRYFGESETGYGLPNSGFFDNVGTSSSATQQQVAICLRNFEISDGSIIRTKDSQALGAHYLNETDLGAKSREECLSLCCKVQRCNVAVFEEKNSGSCYLFDCGTLEDFRCKFTNQNHYVSAILRRRENVISPDHSSGSIMDAHINTHSHNQHEDELSQLRESDKSPGIPVEPAAVMSAGALTSDGNSKSKQTGGELSLGGGNSITSISSTPAPVGLSVDGSTGDSPRCSRWQFECKSSRECIAIYNVCDKIPNCPDGSDESEELHCPPTAGYESAVDTSVNKQKGSSSTLNQQLQPSQSHHPQPPVPISGVLDKSFTLNNGPSGLSNQVPLRQSEDYSQVLKSNGAGGIVNVPRKNADIFSHKDGGIMDDAYTSHQQQQQMHNYGPFWKQPNYDYGNGDTQSGSMYGPLPPPPQFPINGNGNPYGGNLNYGNNGPYQYSGYQNMQGPLQQSSSQGLPIIPPGPSAYSGGSSNYNLPNNSPQQPQQVYYSGQQLQGNNAVVPMSNSNTLPQPGQNVQNAGTAPVTSNVGSPSQQQISNPQTTTSKPNNVGQQGAPQSSNNIISKSNKDSISKLENEFMKSLKAQSLQSGSSEVQSEELSPHTAGAGAVFIFILGLGMSIIMAIVVGCRLRRVGRRQRGKNRLDPDYLVDGMYL